MLSSLVLRECMSVRNCIFSLVVFSFKPIFNVLIKGCLLSVEWTGLEKVDNDETVYIYTVYIYVYVIARAGVIFGIYFTSCRYSGG